MGLKILAIGTLLLGVSLAGGNNVIPEIVTAILIIIGSIGVLANY